MEIDEIQNRGNIVTHQKCINMKAWRILCVILSVVFIFSSLSKMVNIHSFAMETRELLDLYMPAWLHGLHYPCAMMVCWVELLLGASGLRSEYQRVALIGMFAILSFFVFLTAENAFFPTMLGSVESCGCFGELLHFTSLASFVKSALLWSVTVMALAVEGNTEGRIVPRWNSGEVQNVMNDMYVWIWIATAWILTALSYIFVNSMDHWAYLSMYFGICLTSVFAAGLMKKRD